jgi:hypothetical protein
MNITSPQITSTGNTRILLTFLLVIFTCFAGPGSIAAKEASIDDLFVTNSDAELLLYMTVRDCFTEEMVTGLHNGIPATFTFFIDLYQTKKAWPDRKIVSHVFNRTLAFDNLKEEYTIISSTNNNNATTQSLDRAKILMSEITDFSVINLQRLAAGTTYSLRVKVKLAKKTLPLYFHYLIPFSSLWDFETDWHIVQFSF